MKTFKEFINEGTTTMANYSENVDYDIRIDATKHSIARERERKIPEHEIIMTVRAASSQIIDFLVNDIIDISNINKNTVRIYSKQYDLFVIVGVNRIEKKYENKNKLLFDVVTVFRPEEEQELKTKDPKIAKAWKLIEVE